MKQLSGKTAVVTGAASGIGFATARAFAKAGMRVVLADIEKDALSAADGNQAAAARSLDLTYDRLRYHVRKLDLRSSRLAPTLGFVWLRIERTGHGSPNPSMRWCRRSANRRCGIAPLPRP